MLSERWRFQQLAKQFEVLVRDLKESEDAEQRKQFLLRMKAILNEVDELTLIAIPRWNSTRNTQE